MVFELPAMLTGLTASAGHHLLTNPRRPYVDRGALSALSASAMHLVAPSWFWIPDQRDLAPSILDPDSLAQYRAIFLALTEPN